MTEGSMEDSIKASIIKNSFWNFFVMFFNRIGALVLTVILARFLLPEKYGLYSIVLSVCMLFVTFSDLGLNTAMIRYLSGKSKSRNSANYSYIFRLKTKMAVIFSLILLLLAYPLAVFIFHNEQLIIPMIVAALYVFLYSFDAFYSNLFVVGEKFHYLALKEFFSQVLRIVFCLLVLLFLESYYQVAGIFAVFCAVCLLAIAIFLIFRRSILGLDYHLDSSITEKEKTRIFVFTKYLAITSLAGMVLGYMDSLFLGYFLTPQYVGFYRAAFSIVGGVVGLLSFSSTVLLQSFTKIGKLRSSIVANKTFRYLLMLVFPAIFALIVLGRYFVVLLFGYDYLPAAVPLYFMSFAIFPMTLGVLAAPLFLSADKPKEFARISIISILLTILLNLFFIKMSLFLFPENPLYACCGLALSLVISWAYYNGASLVKLKEHFNIRLNIFALSVKPVIASLAMSAFVLFMLNYLKDINLANGVFISVTGAAVYFISLFALGGIRKNDIMLIRFVFKRYKK